MTPDRPAMPSPQPPTAAPGLDALPRDLLGFCERLRHLPLGAWASAAEPAGGSAPERASAAARHRLRRVVDGMPHVAEQSRRRVLDLVAAAEGFVHPATVARMKKCALTAALAIAARPTLGEDDFAQLYRPFATLIPPHLLGAGPDGRAQTA
jgi:hypothetical protein